MSYEVLARKWRPANFSELVGQEHVQRALMNALDEDRLHHAYLFTGTRGVGKTTIARIFAKSLNCETGITSTPCGKCSTCVEIAEGRYIDLIEVDAASRTGVDDTRELLENVQYAPTRGRYKVYLIDEVHMFSKSSFNALLKTLEEPPPHVKFLLATTDPQKLPVTVLSRCLQFNLKRMTVSLILGQLEQILQSENIEHDLIALQLLAEGADGSMRDGLSLLDQAIAFGGGKVHEAEVREMLGTVSRDNVLKILQSLIDRDAEQVMQQLNVLSDFTPDFEAVLTEIISILHHMAMAKSVPAALDGFVSAREQLVEMTEQISGEDLQLFYQIAVNGRKDLPVIPDKRSGLEMILLRMMTFRPALAGQSVPAAPVAASAPAARSKPGSTAPATESTTEPTPAPATKAAPAEVKEPAAPVKQAATSDDWCQIIESLAISGLVRELAANCIMSHLDESSIELKLDPGHKQLLNQKAEKRLTQALGEYFDRDLRLDISVSSEQQAIVTPAKERAREVQEKQQHAEQSIEQDSFVQAMKETFNAEVVPGSVKPVTENTD